MQTEETVAADTSTTAPSELDALISHRNKRFGEMQTGLDQRRHDAIKHNDPYEALIAELHAMKAKALADFNAKHSETFNRLEAACDYAARCCSELNVPFNYKEHVQQ